MRRHVTSPRRLSQPNLEHFIDLNMTTRTSLDVEPQPTLTTTEKYSKAIHAPTRFLPQNQAVLTTKQDGTILLFNDIASLCFKIDKSFIGKSVLSTLLEDPSRKQMTAILSHRKRQPGHVLVCGTIVSIVKGNGTKSIASLWLKEKNSDQGESIYLWIFEEIYETSLSVYMDSECTIHKVLGTMIETYGYKENEMIGKPIHCLIPALANEQHNRLDKMGELKFFGSQTNKGASFPVLLHLSRHVAMDQNDRASFVVKITSLPCITGSLILERSTGRVTEVSAVLAKYLFGRSMQHILDRPMYAESLIPCLSSLLPVMKRRDTLSGTQCRQRLKDTDIVHVVHRDGSHFEIELQLNNKPDGFVEAIITYDRIRAMSRHERRLEYASKPKRPAAMRSLRICSFGAVEEHKRLFPILDVFPPSPSPSHLELTSQTHSLDDYVILSTLGQGTYGMAKLAYRKDDPSMRKVVIKYIFKSRILIDSWIRDRQLGSIPMEIHILRKLQRHPHNNCCQLVTFMEDDDYYFLVMNLLDDSMDLFDYIESNNDMTEDEMKRIFYQVACATKHLHQQGIVHRDIKDENIILDRQGRVLLIDFGCATYYKRGKRFDTFAGTLEYCAPEILQGQPYAGPPQDIWSCGVLLYTLIYHENPFHNIDEIMEKELRVPFVLSEASFDLISRMLQRDVESRLNIDDVLNHPWFHDVRQ
ncbi:kinase-like domain-containing protein [Blakeslea trispora]|nr:kinase-like domain-containing protein [Blakeslea trispora]